MLRAARLLVRDAATADDLAQETMFKSFRSIDQFAEGTNARAWLYSILRNVRIDWLRADARRKNDVSLDGSESDFEHPGLSDDPVVCIEDGDDAEQLMDRLADSDLIDAVHALPEEIRWTILLVEIEGLELARVAAILGVPLGTIKSRASRGRAMLRQALEPIACERGWIRNRGGSVPNGVNESESSKHPERRHD